MTKILRFLAFSTWVAALSATSGCRAPERVELGETSFAVVHLTFET